MRENPVEKDYPWHSAEPDESIGQASTARKG